MTDIPFETKHSGKPFVIELEQQDLTPGGYFTPAASMKVTPALRDTGLLRVLPPESVAWLAFLLTFLSTNGQCKATLEDLCAAMHVSKSKAQKRMGQLGAVEWDGWPLVTETRQESGQVTYALSDRAIHYEHKIPPPSEPPRIGGFREQIIAHSRATYARPRAEAERMVEEQYGRGLPQAEADPALHELRVRLENIGITGEQAYSLIGAYAPEVIERQLEWLPYRNAKNPVGFLIAAIEGDYEEPLSLKLINTVEAANATPPQPSDE